MKNKILFNFLSSRIGGGRTYMDQLLNYLNENKEISERFDFLLLTSTPSSRPIPENVKFICLFQRNFILRNLFEFFLLPFYCRLKSIDVLFCTTDRMPLFRTCKTYTLIRNANLYQENVYSNVFLENLRIYILKIISKSSLKKSDGLIYVSNSIKQMVLRAYPELKNKRSMVIPHGVGKLDKNKSSNVNEDIQLYKPYICYISSIYNYKNFEDVIKAMALINPSSIKSLLIIGKPIETNYYLKLQEMVSVLNLKSRVFFLGEISDSKRLSDYIQNSKIMCITSKIESFGHPVFESLWHNKPVILSKIDVFKEFFEEGNVIKFYDVNDIYGLKEKILELSDKTFTGEDYKKITDSFQSWNETFLKTLQFITE